MPRWTQGLLWRVVIVVLLATALGVAIGQGETVEAAIISVLLAGSIVLLGLSLVAS